MERVNVPVDSGLVERASETLLVPAYHVLPDGSLRFTQGRPYYLPKPNYLNTPTIMKVEVYDDRWWDGNLNGVSIASQSEIQGLFLRIVDPDRRWIIQDIPLGLFLVEHEERRWPPIFYPFRIDHDRSYIWGIDITPCFVPMRLTYAPAE